MASKAVSWFKARQSTKTEKGGRVVMPNGMSDYSEMSTEELTEKAEAVLVEIREKGYRNLAMSAESCMEFTEIICESLRRLTVIDGKAKEVTQKTSEKLVEAHRLASGNHALSRLGAARDEEPVCLRKMRRAGNALLARLRILDEIRSLCQAPESEKES